MDENYTSDSVRSRLILAGLKELDQHGVVDFSLRRVAIGAGVSCAAPYRHFKDKDELIFSIIEYVMEGWTILSSQIGELFSEDARGLITELATAGLRFWIANGNFRTVIMNSDRIAENGGTMFDFERPIINAIGQLGSSCDQKVLEFKVLAALYGAISLVDGGRYSADDAAQILKKTVCDILIQNA